MIRSLVFATTFTGISVMLAVGCGQTESGTALDATLEQVDRIRNDDSLDPQEKRDALAAFGIDPVIINGLLNAVRLANQDGARLEVGSTIHTGLAAAIYKVANDQLDRMTPDEVQYYGDATEVATYDDAEAQAIVDFFGDNQIDSRNRLEELLDTAAIEVPPAIDETNLRDVFIETSMDDVRDRLP